MSKYVCEDPDKIIFDQEDQDLWDNYLWSQTKDGYWCVNLRGISVYFHRLVIERWGHELPVEYVIDHKDGCPWNNCRDNLQILHIAADKHKQRSPLRNYDMPRFVYHNPKRTRPYYVQVRRWGQMYSPGQCFETIGEAEVAAYNLLEQIQLWEHQEVARYN